VTEQPSTQVETILDLLRSEGNRITTSRRMLVEALIAAQDHRTAEELTGEVQRRAPEVSASTIYRNLDEFERLGIVEHAHFGHGAATYHLSALRHGHLVCNECGSVIEVPDEIFKSLIDKAKSKYKFVIDPHHFAMLGHCTACSANLSKVI
jgi:Fur family ferric uptake transcriptional regulator